MSMKRLTIILVQLIIMACLLMVAYTFLLYSGNSEHTVAAVSLLSGGARSGLHMGSGIIDGGFVMGVAPPGRERSRMLSNHRQHQRDGEGLVEMVDVVMSSSKNSNDGGGGGGGGDTGNIVLERYNEHDVKTRQLRDKIERLTAHSFIGLQADEAEMHALDTSRGALPRPYTNVSTPHVHVFYSAAVPWYDTSADGAQRFGQPEPPAASSSSSSASPPAAEAGANRIITVLPLQSEYYPLLGLYTATPKILDVHFRNILQAGVGVLVVGWSPPAAAAWPTTTASTEQLLHVMQQAKKATAGRLLVAVEMRAYEGRSVRTLRADLEQLRADGVWTHPAMYRVRVHRQADAELPMVYVREACECGDHEEWAELLAANGAATVRGTGLDAFFVGEVASKKDASTIRRGHLDGMYTRAATNGATYASTWKNWDVLKQTADRYRLLFIPTVAPGFHERSSSSATAGHHRASSSTGARRSSAGAVDAALRRHRSNGQYYGVAWRTATSIGAQFVSIASYNDWPAGTQIEEAIPYAGHKDYQPTGPRKYLDLTKHWVEEFVHARIEEAKAAAKGKYKGLECVAFFNNTVC